MKKLFAAAIIVAACLAAGQTFVRAEDAPIPQEKKDALKKLFVAMKLEDGVKSQNKAIFDQVSMQVPMMISQMGSERSLAEADVQAYSEKEMPKMLEKLAQGMSTALDTAAIMDQIYLPLYAKTFEQADLEAILAFYESPAGQKMVVAAPELTTTAMQNIYETFGPKLQEFIKGFGAETEKQVGEALDKLKVEADKNPAKASEPPTPPALPDALPEETKPDGQQ
jgi:uncharacterized protein